VVIEAVHLYGPFGLSELGPWEYGKAQVDGGGVDGIEGVLETEPVPGRQVPATIQKMIKEFLKHTPVPFVVGIRERAPVHTPETNVVPPGRLGYETGLDVPQRVFLLDLGVEYRDKLLPCAEGLHVSVSPVPFHGLLKTISRIKFKQLGKYSSQFVHGLYLLVGIGFCEILLSNKEVLQAMLF
jgi:hypothetical protein